MRTAYEECKVHSLCNLQCNDPIKEHISIVTTLTNISRSSLSIFMLTVQFLPILKEEEEEEEEEVEEKEEEEKEKEEGKTRTAATEKRIKIILIKGRKNV